MRGAKAPLQPKEAGASPAEVGRRRFLAMFAGLLFAALLAALDQTIVATALPTITGSLHGLDHLGWVITAYLLAQTVVMPVHGKLGDVLGRKPLLLAAIAIFLAGSALCGAARSWTSSSRSAPCKDSAEAGS